MRNLITTISGGTRSGCRGAGEIGIFNRSYYEEVLVVRVHPEVLERQKLPKDSRGPGLWKRRFREINDWERTLTDNGIKVVKLFLNLSKEEQRTRFLRRIDLPDHNWKFSSADVREREHWDEYQKAFSEMLTHTSTEWAPWYVIPADRKWFARIAAGAVIANALIDIDPRYPMIDNAAQRPSKKIKKTLEAQAPPGAAADPFAARSESDSPDDDDEQASTRPVPAEQRWYALEPADVANTLGVDVDSGLSAAEAAERLKRDGPNALPEEKPPSRLRRLLGQYTSYMQIILVAASVVSLVIKQWSTAIVLFVLSLINAVTGLRQEGKAESAMNALKSMMEATARVRRDGVEAEIPAEQLVVGDVVLIAAGDEVPADGRIVSSSSLQIDESALTGESVPAAKAAETLSDGELGAGDQKNMAFMHTPVTHGSGVMIVTSVGGNTEVGKIAGMLSATATEETPLTKQMNTLTLWIVGAAGITMIIMFALGLYRGQSWTMLFTTAVALAIAAIPLALPMVVQVVLSLGSVELAKQKAIVKDLPSVETLGFTSAINSDKTGTLTMNQMTAVEVLDPTDRYTITGSGYSLEGKISHPAGKTDTLDDAILPYVVANDPNWLTANSLATPPRARCSCSPTRPGCTSTRHGSSCRAWRRSHSIPPTN